MGRLSDKASVPAAIVLLASLLGQGCLTLLGKRSQGVTFTSRPPGARVLVDGRPEGVTPLGLHMNRGSVHTVRIEKDGYRPVEIRIGRRKNWPVILLSNLAWFPPLFLLAAASGVDAQSGAQEKRATALVALSILVPIAAVAVDAGSAKSALLRPTRLSIGLEKNAGPCEPFVVSLSEEDFRGISWISLIGD